MRMAGPLLMALAACVALAVPCAAFAADSLSHGRFDHVVLYRPPAETRQVVLFLSGDHGWDAAHDRLARALAAEGALVAGIATPPLLRSFSSEGRACVYPDGDLENLSHWLQGYVRLPTYFRPLLIGYASGAGLAYAALAQAPAGTFGGVVALALCPHLAMDHPPCDAAGAVPTTRATSTRRPAATAHAAPPGGTELTPAKLTARCIVVQGARDRLCPVSRIATFVAHASGAELVQVPGTGHELSDPERWRSPLLSAYRRLAAANAAALPPPPSAVGDLPLIEVPTTGTDARFAVLLSGDGGWAGLDKDVADALASRGVPVAGWDSLRYFWTARTPDGLAADLDRVLRFYAAQWGRSRAIVIGYSQGADVLPFALNRLPAPTRALVAGAVLMGLGENASFEFHLADWIGSEDESALPIRPEAEKLAATTALCLYGADDTESICPSLGGAVRAVKLAGGHHFDGDYPGLATIILDSTR